MHDRDLPPMLAAAGYALVAGVFTPDEVVELRAAIDGALRVIDDDAVALRNRAGVYGARNVLEICPAARTAWRKPRLLALLSVVLGEQFGLVRGLYFDKPPARSWSLPWHQDLTIAVADNSLPSRQFVKPTRKAGVPHVEAPAALLHTMLTLRIHLDAATPENGPLQVLPGTHREARGAPPSVDSCTILAAAGDVLAMRPLLFHASGASVAGTTLHRRVLHLEFAAQRVLPEGFAWHEFWPV